MLQKTWKNRSVRRLMEEYRSEDPVQIIRWKARDLVLQAFEKGWVGPPFDPFVLARLLGFAVSPNEAIADARILDLNKRFQIEYNPYQRPTRINFSISHELGHALFEDWADTIRNREEDRDGELWELEFLCDVAASEILLPYAVFAEDVNSKPLNMQTLLDIANKYQASLEAVFLRFAEVVNKPCGVLIASFTGEEKKELVVDYFKASLSSELRVPSGFHIPAVSKAYECINSGWTSQGAEHWDVFGEEYKVFSIGLPPLKKHRRQRVGIFIVPEIYDEPAANALYTVNGDATQPRGSGRKIIVQVVNTTAAVGMGFGRSMAAKWPKSKSVLQSWKGQEDFKLGNARLTKLDDDHFVYQMLVQDGVRPKFAGQTILSYVGLQRCLEELRGLAKETKASIHMPMIGAGQAKGDWNIIEGIIYDELVQHGVTVTVYVLPGTKFNPKNRSPLTLFDTSSMYEKK